MELQQEIQKEIEMYLNRREHNGALLLSGRWGSGKSHLLRQIQADINEQSEFVMVIVSLFGVGNAEALKLKVKEKIIPLIAAPNESVEKTQFLDRSRNRLRSLMQTAKFNPKFSMVANSLLSVNIYDLVDIKQEVLCLREGKIHPRQLVLAFDDLERCSIKQLELMGTINEYVENRKIKTILVADESHITDETFREMKEKVITRTIELHTDYREAIHSMIRSFHETVPGYSAFMEQCEDVLVQVYEESGSMNLRSFHEVMLAFERVYRGWQDCKAPMGQLDEVLYLFAADMMERRCNNFEYDEGKGGRFLDGETWRKYRSFAGTPRIDALSRWIATGEWNGEAFRQEIQKHYTLMERSAEEHFLFDDLWSLNDGLIQQAASSLIQKTQCGQLDADALVNLILRLHQLRRMGYPLPDGLGMPQIEQGLVLREEGMLRGEIRESFVHTKLPEMLLAEMDDEERQLYSRVVRLYPRSLALEQRWHLLVELLKKSEKCTRILHSSLVSLDQELEEAFFQAYSGMGNADRRMLCNMLSEACLTDSTVSGESDLEVTKENLQKLLSDVTELWQTETDFLARWVHQQTLETIRAKLKELQKKD